MHRSILLRLGLLPFLLLLANFGGFAYALLSRAFHESLNPYGSGYQGPGPLFVQYRLYLNDLFSGTLAPLPNSTEPLVSVLASATAASLGLLAIAFLISALLGLYLGMHAVHSEKAGLARWLSPLAALGQAMPSFYMGTLLIAGLIYYLINQGPGATSPLPLSGFGWDLHLILPVVSLCLRPTVQAAWITAGLLSGEMSKQYITTARSHGSTWTQVRWKHAFRNVLAPYLLTLAGNFRWLVGELVLVEWLFAWPGLGRLISSTLIPPVIASAGGLGGATPIFLHPPLLASLMTILALLFLAADTLSTTAARRADPRFNAPTGEVQFD